MIAGVPYDAEIEYLEASNGPYVDTGIDSVNVSRIAHSWSFVDRSSKTMFFFGHSVAASGVSNRTRVLGVLQPLSHSEFGYVDYGRPSGTYRYIFNSPSVEDDKPIDISDDRTYSSRILLFRAALPRSTVSPETAPTVPVRLHYFRIWDKSRTTLVRDFIPVRVGSMGYLYDRVTGRLYGNSGTGSFVLGPDVARPVLPMRMVSVKPYDAEIEYLESTGTQYVDTGVVPGNGTTYDIRFQRTRTNATEAIFGLAYSSVGVLQRVLGTSTRIEIGRGGSSQTHTVNITNDTNWHIVLSSATEIVVDGVPTSRDFSALTAPYSLYAFAQQGSAGIANAYAKARISHLKIYDGQTLVRDFIPVRIGQVGFLYDRANPAGGPFGNGLYPNSGTGSFVLGPDISVEHPLAGLVPVARNVRILPYDAEVEYVESDGSNWVETDYVPTAGAFAIDMTALTPWRGGFLMYFGAYVSNSNRLYATNESGGKEYIAWQYGTKRLNITLFPWVNRARKDYTFSGNTYPFYVFHMANSPTSFHPANARFRSAQFWDSNGDLTLDLIPVRVGSMGYLYDRANPTGGPLGNGLYGSATSTPLIAGPDK